MIKIACVLKSGGFNLEYAFKMLRAVERTVSQEHRLIVLSDLEMPPEGDSIRNGLEHSDIEWQSLVDDLPGWWSKMELFRIHGPVLYFDLDTILTGNIDGLCDTVQSLDDKILMLRGFRHKDVASGIMAWDGDMSWITDEFLEYRHCMKFVEIKESLRMKMDGTIYRGDQEWLSGCLRTHVRGVQVVFAQDVFDGIYSYKNHVRPDGLPNNAKIVCFHGRPRPADVQPPPQWLKEHWSC